MRRETKSSFRPLQDRERQIIERLLDHPFQGRDELRQQLDSTTARVIEEHHDNYGSIELRVTAPAARADVKYRVPVEAEYRDEDGIPVWVLLHVKDRMLHELEIVRADGRPLILAASAGRIEPY